MSRGPAREGSLPNGYGAGRCPCGLPLDLPGSEDFCWTCRGASGPGMLDVIPVEEHDKRVRATRNEYVEPTPKQTQPPQPDSCGKCGTAEARGARHCKECRRLYNRAYAQKRRAKRADAVARA